MAEGLSGSLAQIPLSDLLKMLAAGSQTGRLRLMAGTESCDLYVQQGLVVHAETEDVWGEPAFIKIMSWTNANFRFEPGMMAPDQTIEKSFEQLHAESERIVSERETVRRVIPSLEALPRLVRELPAPEVTIQPADWRVIALMDGRTSIAGIGRELGMDDISLVKQMYRLKTGGLIDLEVPQQRAAPSQRVLAGPAFFHTLTAAVADAIGPLAEVIVDDCVEVMGFTRNTFPRDGVSVLAERIAAEIRDDQQRVRFQQRILSMLRQMAA
jgi:hypothetical protein